MPRGAQDTEPGDPGKKKSIAIHISHVCNRSGKQGCSLRAGLSPPSSLSLRRPPPACASRALLCSEADLGLFPLPTSPFLLPVPRARCDPHTELSAGMDHSCFALRFLED